MNSFIINETSDTPGIKLDPVSHTYEFTGRSLPEDPESFYRPVIEWFEQFGENGNNLVLIVKLIYFNTASSKMLLDIFLILEEMKTSGKDIKINWYYHVDDEDMEEAGKEYAEMVDVPFEHMGYN